MGQCPEVCIFFFTGPLLSLTLRSLEILQDWISLIDEDGWVGREQILGEEARSRVCQPFLIHALVIL